MKRRPITAQRLGEVAIGLLMDRACGDPVNRWHPTAWFGRSMGALESVIWRDSRAAGVGYAAIGIAISAGAGVLLGRLPAGVAVAVWASVAGRTLREAGAQIEEHLLAADLGAARAALPTLVGRDPSALDESGVAAAVIESLAENTVDAVIAPVLWAVVGGAPGVLAYRAINTMDAMVGHRSARYRNFGWAAARVDDAANWIPARLFAVLVMLAAPGRAGAALHAVRRDATAHPSPNSGVAEAAVAGALAIELGGPLRYGQRCEDRPRLGSGPRPEPTDIGHAARLVNRVEILTFTLLVFVTITKNRGPA